MPNGEAGHPAQPNANPAQHGEAGPQPPERITPILQFSVLCDAVGQDANTHKLSFFGVFDRILQPIVMQQFFIVNRWTNGLGNFRQTITFLRPDLTPVAPVTAQDFVIHSRTEGAGIMSGFLGFNFAIPGVWWIEVRLDDELVLAYPLPVLERSGPTTPVQN
jgi:hypothetical protein